MLARVSPMCCSLARILGQPRKCLGCSIVRLTGCPLSVVRMLGKEGMDCHVGSGCSSIASRSASAGKLRRDESARQVSRMALFQDFLGDLDEDVARRTGHSVRSVLLARSGRRIPSVYRRAPDWRPEQEALLGTASDEAIAARLNRTISAVRGRRQRKGIKEWEGVEVGNVECQVQSEGENARFLPRAGQTGRMVLRSVKNASVFVYQDVSRMSAYNVALPL